MNDELVWRPVPDFGETFQVSVEGSSVVERGTVNPVVEGSIPSPPANIVPASLMDLILSDEPYFPGRDFPDREKWLERRYTNPSKRGVPCALLARGQVNNRKARRSGRFNPDLPKAQPLYGGINRMKRVLNTTEEGHKSLVQQRQDFYNRRSDEQARTK